MSILCTDRLYLSFLSKMRCRAPYSDSYAAQAHGTSKLTVFCGSLPGSSKMALLRPSVCGAHLTESAENCAALSTIIGLIAAQFSARSVNHTLRIEALKSAIFRFPQIQAKRTSWAGAKESQKVKSRQKKRKSI